MGNYSYHSLRRMACCSGIASSTIMSKSHSSSAWENPRHFFVPLPPELNSSNLLFPAAVLACSKTHLILAHKDRVYIYSLPTFDLVHALRPGDLSKNDSVQIYGRVLVITCNLPQGSKDSPEGSVLHIWDLSEGEFIGTVEARGSVH